MHTTRSYRRLVLGFSAILSLPLTLAPLSDHAARATWEKRPLKTVAEVAKADSVDSFFGNLESFFDDHLFGALSLNRAYRRFQLELLRDPPVDNIAVGENDLVFLTSHDAELPRASLVHFCNPKEALVDELFEGLSRLSEYLAKEGVSLHLAIVPSKLSLYTEYLPPTLPNQLRQNCINRVANKGLAANGLESRGRSFGVFYPRDQMFALRDTPHFYPPENFHANSRLNHEFALEYFRELGLSGKSVSATATLETIEADLTLMGFEREVSAWVYEYAAGVTRYRRAPEWLRPVYSGARGFGRYETEEPLSSQKVLMLSDSFGAFLAPHLAAGFAELMHVNIKHLKASEVAGFLETALRETNAATVMLLYHDAGLPNQSLSRFLAAVP